MPRGAHLVFPWFLVDSEAFREVLNRKFSNLYNKEGIIIRTFDKEYLDSLMNRNDKKNSNLLKPWYVQKMHDPINMVVEKIIPNIHDAFSVHPVSYGLLSTDDVAGERVLATKIEARGG